MVSMKKDLLQMVQDMLEELDGDQVNSIDDTIEATQIANIIATTYFDLIAHRTIPEHKELFRLNALGDSTRPNYLVIPDDVEKIETFWYNVSDDTKIEYREMRWEDPTLFLRRVSRRDSTSSVVDTVLDFNGNTELLIFNDKMPTYYTTFDDKHIVVDSYDSTVESTLQNSNSRCYGLKTPTVTITDTFTFDIDADYFPYLYNEALSRVAIAQQKTENPKAEQWSRRHRTTLQSEKNRVEQPNRRPNYGRH